MKTHRAAALFLALLSGAAGVGHQLVWTRRLVDLLGAGSETFSKVIGAFFIGLAFGAWLSTRSLWRGMPAWRRVACAELAVALLALPILILPQTGFLPGVLGMEWARIFLPIVLVGAPALAMGLVIPWVIDALGECHPRSDSASSGRWPVWLYATNTLGGVMIVPCVLLWLLPGLGLTGASMALVFGNLLVAAGALALSSGGKAQHRGVIEEESVELPASFKWTAFASGFLVLGFEVVLQHQLAQVTINSLYSSGAVLSLVLFSLMLAAAVAPFLAQRLGDKGLFYALIITVLLALAQPFCLNAMRPGLEILPYELTAIPYVWEVLKLGAVAVLPFTLASGLIFPLLLVRVKASARAVGLLLAWNGVGGWLGAEFMQTAGAPQLGLWTSVTAIALGYALLLLVAARRPYSIQAVVGFAVVLAMICSVGFATRRLPQATVNPEERLVQVEVSREGVVATVECAPEDWRMLFNNSYTLGGSRAQFNQERQAHLPVLLHGRVQRVACLGIATGSTVAGAALHTNVQSIDAIELAPVVAKHAERYFAPFNRNVLKDSRVRVIENDARWVMAQSDGEYDVVIGDLFLPWRTGEARLFALEHFQNVRRALKPDGLYCQWLPLFQLTRPQYEAIARTFAQVFTNAFIVRGDFYAELPILGLIGGREMSQVDWGQVAKGCEGLRANGAVTDPLVRHVEGIALMVLGPLPVPQPGPINTLGNAWLEWDAGRNILGMSTPWFVGVPEAEYVREVHRGGAVLMPEALRAWHDSGQFFLTLEIAAKLSLPFLEPLKQQMNERVPETMRRDAAADWRQWPMAVKPRGR